MVDPSGKVLAQSKRVLFAWLGALLMLPILYRTAAASLLASPSYRFQILCGLVCAVALFLRGITTRALPAWMSLSGCAVLGALFTSISVSFTMLASRLFA